MPKLIIVKPDSAPEDFELTEDSATIGRAPENTIVIDDVGCSRRHCQLIRISSGFEIVDLGSRNGTKINGRARKRHVLQEGDTVEIGKTTLTYQEREGSVEEVVLEDFGGGQGGATEGYLVYTDKDRKGEKVVLGTDRTTVGRKSSNTIVLKDPMASSYHCEIVKEGGGFILRDLGSTNGSLVNGEPVSETALSHGDRIRLGKTSFVFVDPAVADYEKALAAEEDAESEWGLMRDQLDMARVRRKRRASLIWLTLFVVVLGGSAAVFTLKPDLVREILGIEETKVIVAASGNMVTDFSFEDGLLDWSIPEGRPGTATVTAGPAHQGDKSLLLDGPVQGIRSAVVTPDEDHLVSSSRNYELSAWVKTEAPGTVAVAAVVWLSPEEKAVRRFSLTPKATKGEWTQVRTVVRPPKDADRAEVALAVVGPGSARFDDVVFRPTDEAPSRVSGGIESGGFTVILGDNGALAVVKTGRFLLWNGGLVGLTADATATEHGFRFFADDVKTGGGAATIKGRLLTPGGEVPATLSITAKEDRLELSYELGGKVGGLSHVGLGFQVARDYLAEGATVSGESGAEEIHSETDAEGVEKVILGGSGRQLSITCNPPVRFRMLPGGELRMALLTPVGEKPPVFELITDFSRMQTEARKLLADARGARTQDRFGDAIKLFDRVIVEFPFDERVRNQAEKERDQIVAKGTERLEEAKDLFEEARDFYDEADLARARRQAEGVRKEFGDHKLAQAAAKLQEAIDQVVEKRRESRAAVAADRLIMQAEDLKKRGQKRLATVFFRKVLDEYGETEAAAKAREALDKLTLQKEGGE